MKRLIQLFLFGLLVAGCSRVPSDAEIRKKAPGAWVVSAGRSILTFAPDGTYETKIPGVDLKMQGTWQVVGGFFIVTTTNAVGTQPHSAEGEVQRLKIVSMDDHDLVLQMEGKTNLVTAHKQ